jgi:hypothetical protein
MNKANYLVVSLEVGPYYRQLHEDLHHGLCALCLRKIADWIKPVTNQGQFT